MSDKLDAMHADLVRNLTTIERMRGLLKPLGTVADTLEETLSHDPDLEAEIKRAHTLVLAATASLMEITGRATAIWEERWGKNESAPTLRLVP